MTMTDRISRIKACLNGRRTPAEHPAVPVTPGQLAAAAVGAVGAGAEAVHLHPRAADGQESLAAADVGAAVAAVRIACPGTPVGVTTGLWAAAGDAALRYQQVAGWRQLRPEERPDFASVNLSEDGWLELLTLLAGLEIGAEAGVWSVADAIALTGTERAGGSQPGWLRIMVEILGVSAPEAAPRADEIVAQLRSGGADAPVLLHGEDESCWPLITHAGRLGLATRVGLEDVLAGPDGREVTGNADLVVLGLDRWAAANLG
jgi:uncharacterized protein (DUF849 family)